MAVQAVAVSEDAVVESGRRLIQLSPTTAPSLLSTSASETILRHLAFMFRGRC